MHPGTILLPLLLALLAGAVPGRDEKPQTAAQKAFREARTAQFKALLELTGGLDRVLPPREKEAAAKWRARLDTIRATYLGRLEAIVERHPRDRAIDPVALELGRLLYEEHRHGDAARALARIRPGRLEAGPALDAARLLAATGRSGDAARLAAKIPAQRLLSPRHRLLLAGALAAGGQNEPADALLAKGWIKGKDPKVLLAQLADLEVALVCFPPALARPLLARAYTLAAGLQPEAAALKERLTRLPGLALTAGSTAPTLTGKNLTGQAADPIPAGKGLTVLHFWRPGTPLQARDLRTLAALAGEADPARLTVRGVCLHPSPPMALSWVQKQSLKTPPSLAAPAGPADPLCRAYGVVDTPFTVLLEGDRVIALGRPTPAVARLARERLGAGK